MAVTFDAATESHTGTSGNTSADFFEWTHAGTANAKSALVFVWTNADAAYITSVTYAGLTMPAVSGGQAVDSATEPGRSNAFFLPDVPSGNQTVRVNRTNNATTMYGVSITTYCGAGMACQVHTAGIVLIQGDGTVAEQSVTDGLTAGTSLRFAGGHFGHQTLPAAGTNSTLMHSIDIGATGFVAVRETTGGNGSRSVGMTHGTSDDRAIVHLAIKEIFAQSASGGITPTGTVTLAPRQWHPTFALPPLFPLPPC